jgi:hypothetical protein
VFNAQQVEEHCQQQGLAIVGYYHANEYMDDMELPVSAKKIASKIASHCPQAAALLVTHKPAPYPRSGCVSPNKPPI